MRLWVVHRNDIDNSIDLIPFQLADHIGKRLDPPHFNNDAPVQGAKFVVDELVNFAWCRIVCEETPYPHVTVLLEAALQISADLCLGSINPLAARGVCREEHPSFRAVSVILGVPLRTGGPHGFIVTRVQLHAETVHAILEGVALKPKQLAFNEFPQRVLIHRSHYSDHPPHIRWGRTYSDVLGCGAGPASGEAAEDPAQRVGVLGVLRGLGGGKLVQKRV